MLAQIKGRDEHHCSNFLIIRYITSFLAPEYFTATILLGQVFLLTCPIRSVQTGQNMLSIRVIPQHIGLKRNALAN